MKAVMNVVEVAEVFRVHPETIRRRIRDRSLTPIAGFRPFRVRREEVERLLGPCLDR